MEIKACQREMRFAFLGGFAGQLASGTIWVAAALFYELTVDLGYLC